MEQHTNLFSATHAMQNFIITTSEELKKDSDYKKVANIIYKLIEGGITFAAKGYCISVADIVYTLLKQNNIPCKILECHLAITNKIEDKVYAMGFDDLKDILTKADTHVVVVTETKIPMVIDVSIAHMLPNNIQGIIDILVDDNHGGIFANIDTPFISLTYQRKKQNSIPMLHERSILNRINTDIKIFNSLKYLKYIVIGALLISLLNASRGFYDFYSVYIKNNYWGPNAIRHITEKVEAIEKKIDQQNKK